MSPLSGPLSSQSSLSRVPHRGGLGGGCGGSLWGWGWAKLSSSPDIKPPWGPWRSRKEAIQPSSLLTTDLGGRGSRVLSGRQRVIFRFQNNGSWGFRSGGRSPPPPPPSPFFLPLENKQFGSSLGYLLSVSSLEVLIGFSQYQHPETPRGHLPTRQLPWVWRGS